MKQTVSQSPLSFRITDPDSESVCINVMISTLSREAKDSFFGERLDEKHLAFHR